MRGVERIFGTVRQTLARWIQEKAAKLPSDEATLLAAEPDDVLELDEALMVICANKAQPTLGLDVPSVVEPDRSSPASSATAALDSCLACASSSPKATAACCSVQRLLGGVSMAFDAATLCRAVGKETGDSSPRPNVANNTLRQPFEPALCSKTLAFSKSDHFHNAALKLFIHDYNLQCLSVTM